MKPLRRRLRHARLWLQALVATAVIVFALLVGLLRLALPWIASHPEKIAAYLSTRLNRPVAIGHVEASWEGAGPLLSLHDLRLDPPTPGMPAFAIAQAALRLDTFAWLHRNRTWTEFRLLGLELDLSRDAAGAWTLRGLDTRGEAQQAQQNPLFDLGGLVLRDLHLRLDDAMSGRHLEFRSDEVRLLNAGNVHRAAARIRGADPHAAPLDVAVEYDSDARTGEAYVGGRKLDLAMLLHDIPLFGAHLLKGHGRVELWTYWNADKLVQARAEVDVRDVVLEAGEPVAADDKNAIAPRTAFEHLAFGARWQRDANGWHADVADFSVTRQGTVSAPVNFHAQHSGATADAPAQYAFTAERIELGVPVAAAIVSDALPGDLRHWLYAANPDGILENVQLRYAGPRDYDVVADVHGLGWHALGKLPGTHDLSAHVLGDQDALTLDLPPQHALELELPHVFRWPLRFSEFSGTLAAYRTDAGLPDTASAKEASAVRPGWRVETDALTFEGEHYGGQARGAIELHDDGARPLLDMYAYIAHADVTAAHLYWPINIMPPPAVSWLDRALDGGRVAVARTAFRGELADWPFRNLSGRFEGRAEIEDLHLKYLNDWPAAEHVRAAATFINVGLHVDADAGSIQGTKLNNAHADIADMGEPLLDLNLEGQGGGRELLAFVKATPIGQHFAAHLLGVDIGGQGKVDLRLNVPVKQSEQYKLAGTVELTNADLADAKYGIRLAQANGKVLLGRNGFAANGLTATFDGAPAIFSLLAGGFASDPHHAVEANLRVNLPAVKALAYAPMLQAYAAHVSGSTDWNATFSADGDGGAPGSQRLAVTSTLRGVAIDLPEPLKKSADATWPLRLALGLPFAGGSLDLSLGELMFLRGRLPTLSEPFAARVDFGAPTSAALPPRGFMIGGTAPRLDLSGWMEFANASGSGSGSMLAGVDLHTPALNAWERDFGAAQFGLAPASDGIDLTFKGAALDGSMHVPSGELRRRGITAQFNKLYWPELAENDSGSVESENPAALPPLHIHVGDFRLGQANFGEATVESYPVDGGTHFDQVSTHSSNVEMRAQGDWTGRSAADRSTFAIDFSAHNLGRMLDAFGYAGVVDGGATVAHVEGSWAGAPSSFALARLDGTLKVSIKAGRIPEYEPGGARILGLLNLAAIPRRLAFDFGDLFKSGYSFDSIEGLFTLKDGDAYTNDLVVNSAMADMRLTGRTGLKAKDWDQVVEVTPHVSATFAIGGGLIGGPVGAAAGMLLQGVFRNQIAQATRASYKVTGSWKEPTITTLAKIKKTVPASNATSPPPETPPPEKAPAEKAPVKRGG